jgi:hypothetical protein
MEADPFAAFTPLKVLAPTVLCRSLQGAQIRGIPVQDIFRLLAAL